MLLTLAAILLILGPLCAVLLLVGVPLVFGLTLFDVSTWPREKREEQVEPEVQAVRPQPAPVQSHRLSA